MAQSNQSRLLIGGVLLAGLAVYGLTTFLGDLDKPRVSETIDRSPSIDTPNPEQLTPVGSEGDGDSRMLSIPDPGLSVTPVNEEGLPLHTAKILIQGPGGTLETTGLGKWEDIEIGDWAIDVSCEGYLSAHEDITVIDGGQPDVLVTLFRSVDVTGRVIDSLGSPVPLTAVRFLDKDARPRMPRATRGQPQAQTQPDGTFSIQLQEAREYRVSVGTGTEPLLTMDGSILLEPGDHEVDIVVPGRGSVELALTDLPNAAKAKKGSLHARIYTRKSNTRKKPDNGTGLGDPSRAGLPQLTPPVFDPNEDRTRTGKRRMIGSPKPEGSTETQPDVEPKTLADPLAMDPLGPEWIHKSSSVVGLDGTASFDRLVPKRDYRLVLEVRRVKFQSVDIFQVDPNRMVTLRAAVPPLPLNAEGKIQKGTIRPLDVFIDYRAIGPDVPPVGFHWKQSEE